MTQPIVDITVRDDDTLMYDDKLTLLQYYDLQLIKLNEKIMKFDLNKRSSYLDNVWSLSDRASKIISLIEKHGPTTKPLPPSLVPLSSFDFNDCKDMDDLLYQIHFFMPLVREVSERGYKKYENLRNDCLFITDDFDIIAVCKDFTEKLSSVLLSIKYYYIASLNQSSFTESFITRLDYLIRVLDEHITNVCSTFTDSQREVQGEYWLYKKIRNEHLDYQKKLEYYIT